MTDSSSPGRRMEHQPWLVKHRITLALVALGAVLLTSCGGWAYYLKGQLDDVDRVALELDDQRRPARAGASVRGAVNILLAGADAGGGPSIAESVAAGKWDAGSHRSDTIMLLHITANHKKAYLVSVPRDTLVDIDGVGKSKINAAFSEGGPSLYVDTMEQFTGLRMDHLAIIDWAGFKDMTTAVGGVPVFVPEDIYDPSQEVQWDRGMEKLEGKRALQYVRMRYGLENGDFDRIKRQQNFLRSFMRTMLSQGTTNNPMRVTNTVEAIVKYLTLDEDFTSSELSNLAMSLRDLELKDVTFVTVPQERYDTYNEQSVVIADRRQTKAMFRFVSNDRINRYIKKFGKEGVLGKAENVS